MKFGSMRILIFKLLSLFVAITFSIGAYAQSDFYLSLEEKFLVNYLIMGAGKSAPTKIEIVKKLETILINAVQKPSIEVKVANFEQFLREFRGNWPTGVSVEEAIRLAHQRHPEVRLRTYTSPSPRIQAKINNFLAEHFHSLQSTIGVQSIEGFLELLLQNQNLLSEIHTNKKLTPQISDKMRLLAFEKPEAAFHRAMQHFEKVGEQIAATDMIQLKHEGLKVFLQKALTLYFSELSESTKSEILASYLNGNLKLNEMEVFKIMVMNSGPQFQKLLQIISREAGLGEQLQQVFKSLESSVQAIPQEHVQSLLAKESKNYDFIYFEFKPLGVGTMAQVHRAKIRHSNGKIENVVVRFIKPGIEDRIQMDKMILAKLAPLVDADPGFRNSGFPALTPLVDDLSNTVEGELNLKKTIQLQVLAKEAYETERLVNFGGYKNFVNIRVPTMIDGKGSSELMVQQMAFGKKLDKAADELADLIPNFKQKIAEEIAIVWTEEVMFKSGFFHSDLHQGNFLVNFKEQAIDVTILDFGMAGTISKETQAAALALGIGLELLKLEAIVEGFWSLSIPNKNMISRSEFETLVRDRISKLTPAEISEQTFERWTAWTIDQGLRYPEEFISLNRGLIIIEGMLKEAGSSLTTTSIAKTAALRYPLVVAKLLKSTQLISSKDVLKLGWEKFSESSTPSKPESSTAPSCGSVF